MSRVGRYLTEEEIAERKLKRKINQDKEAEREQNREAEHERIREERRARSKRETDIMIAEFRAKQLNELAGDLSRKPASVRFEVPETPKESQSSELAEFAKSIRRPSTRISYSSSAEEKQSERKPDEPKPVESRVVETIPSDSKRNEIVRYIPKRFDMKKPPRKTYRKEPVTRIIKSGGTEISKKSNGIKSCNIALNIKNKGSLTINNG